MNDSRPTSPGLRCHFCNEMVTDSFSFDGIMACDEHVPRAAALLVKRLGALPGTPHNADLADSVFDDFNSTMPLPTTSGTGRWQFWATNASSNAQERVRGNGWEQWRREDRSAAKRARAARKRARRLGR